MAIALRTPPLGITHHSDRGVQCASHDYVDTLFQHGFRISMSRKGNPYDNATTESFFKTLKSGKVYLWEYPTMDDVKTGIPSSSKKFTIASGCIPHWDIGRLFNQTKSCPVT